MIPNITDMTSQQLLDWLLPIVDVEIFRSREQLIALLASDNPHEELEEKFRFVASQNFHDTASALADGFIQNGFEKQAAAELIRPTDEDQRDLPLFGDRTPPSTEPAPAQRGEVFNVPKLMVQGTQRHLDFEAS